MRVQRNTMSSNSRAGIKWHEAERLGRCRANHFPGVYVQGVAETRHLVSHADVDGAKSILKELRGFGNARRANGEDFFDDLRVELRCRFGRSIRAAADDFRNVVRLKLRIAGINSLRREGEQEICVEFQTRLFKHRE